MSEELPRKKYYSLQAIELIFSKTLETIKKSEKTIQRQKERLAHSEILMEASDRLLYGKRDK